jgi:hypothetical protein
MDKVFGESQAVALPLLQAGGAVFKVGAEKIEWGHSIFRSPGEKVSVTRQRSPQVDRVEAKPGDVEGGPNLLGRPNVADGLMGEDESGNEVSPATVVL